MTAAVVAAGMQEEAGSGAGAAEPRYVRIEPPAVFKRLSYPAVMFDHERHTAALGDDFCGDCHAIGESGFIVDDVAPPADDPDIYATITDKYHDFCNSCHHSRAVGPQACEDCHDASKTYRSALWDAPPINLRSHQKHLEFREGRCISCHHYLEISERGNYDTSDTVSCRDCHTDETDPDAPSIKEVAHGRCISCHVMSLETQGVGGPKECSVCHPRDAARHGPIADMTGVPRLLTGQKDFHLILGPDSRMKPVPFNHMNHEKNVRSCRECHHRTTDKCGSCHHSRGIPGGGYVDLASAFHELNSTRSCIGCHELKKRENPCRQCHENLVSRLSDASCDVCHAGSVHAMPQPVPAANAARLLPAGLPDTFTIAHAAKEHDPVSFPHKRIIDSVSRLLGEDRLAATFHQGRTAVCNTCHHMNPDGKEYMKCSACHLLPYDPASPGRPGLVQAYHGQCVGCHIDMNVTSHDDCSSCHKDIAPSDSNEYPEE